MRSSSHNIQFKPEKSRTKGNGTSSDDSEDDVEVEYVDGTIDTVNGEYATNVGYDSYSTPSDKDGTAYSDGYI